MFMFFNQIAFGGVPMMGDSQDRIAWN